MREPELRLTGKQIQIQSPRCSTLPLTPPHAVRHSRPPLRLFQLLSLQPPFRIAHCSSKSCWLTPSSDSYTIALLCSQIRQNDLFAPHTNRAKHDGTRAHGLSLSAATEERSRVCVKRHHALCGVDRDQQSGENKRTLVILRTERAPRVRALRFALVRMAELHGPRDLVIHGEPFQRQ